MRVVSWRVHSSYRRQLADTALSSVTQTSRMRDAGAPRARTGPWTGSPDNPSAASAINAMAPCYRT